MNGDFQKVHGMHKFLYWKIFLKEYILSTLKGEKRDIDLSSIHYFCPQPPITARAGFIVFTSVIFFLDA